jgi:hypothetical protein
MQNVVGLSVCGMYPGAVWQLLESAWSVLE